jgi:hypothetical protein
MTCRLALFAWLVASVLASSGWAVPITYTFTGRGDGYVGDMSNFFLDKAFTIRVFADTAHIQPSAGPPGIVVLEVEDLLSEISLDGFPTAAFSAPKRVFVNQTNGAVGFSTTLIEMRDLLDLVHPSYAAYDLSYPLPIVAGAQITANGFLQPTNIGTVFVIGIHDATFQAAVPEASTMALSVCILSGLFCSWKRRLRAPNRIARGGDAPTLPSLNVC